jgi:TPR repeat protein
MWSMRLGLAGYTEDRAKRRAKVQDLMVAAAGDDVDAQLALAWQYVQGEFVPVQLATAGNWFERAAASGDEEAIVQRARFLQLRRVPQGLRDLRRLASSGNWKAQFWLAQHYESQPHRISRLKAVVWYDRSFANGNMVAGVAKFILLMRLAPLPSKPIFAMRALKEMARMIGRLAPNERETERYEPLQYSLKPWGT